jgi:3-methyladenine DNA glycosylase AlkD
MAAYMRGQFAYLGIPEPARRKLDRAALRDLPAPSPADLVDLVQGAWALLSRELQYAAIDYLGRNITRAGPELLTPTVESLLTTKAWWDTVDGLRSAAVGPLVARHGELVAVLDRWIDADDQWLVRSALIHQLGYGAATHADRLFDYCARRSADDRFFVRKAIGWALRQYSKVDATAVRSFVAEHPELSGLSRREALAWLDRQ